MFTVANTSGCIETSELDKLV